MLRCTAPQRKLAKGCKILEVPTNSIVKRRRGTRVAANTHLLATRALEIPVYGLHVHDVDQELRSLCNRHLFYTPASRCDLAEWGGFRRQLATLRAEIGRVVPCSWKAMMKGRTGLGRKRMKRGIHEYLSRGVTQLDARVTAMQKLELYEESSLPLKENRTIQYRGVAFNAAVSRYLHVVEHRLMHCVGTNRSGVPFCAKGRTVQQRAVQLLAMGQGFEKPWYISLDHSRFDAHVNVNLLKAEHSVYNWCASYSRELASLLKKQLYNVGYTRGGIKYSAKGKRMSGDVNTSLGNTVLNYAMLSSYLELSGVKGEILLDGDDSVLIVESHDRHKLLNVDVFMHRLGMKTIVEGETGDITQVEFCQAKVVMGPYGPYFCPNPKKQLATLCISPEVRGPDTAYSVFRASILCALHASPSMPMMAPFSRWLQANPGKARASASEEFVLRMYGVDREPGNAIWRPPTYEERLSFYNAWGISPATQIAYEDTLLVTVGKLPLREATFKPLDEVEVSPDIFSPDALDEAIMEWTDGEWSERDEGFKMKSRVMLGI